MDEPYLGLITVSALQFAPRDWAFCNGQLLSISQNAALYAVLGTQFGGDGHTNFALPNLTGRMPLQYKAGMPIGTRGGKMEVTLNQTIEHVHEVDQSTGKAPTVAGGLVVSAAQGGVQTPVNTATLAVPKISSGTISTYADNPSSTIGLAAATATQVVMTGTAGAGAPVSVVPPYQALNYIICIRGLFPPRE